MANLATITFTADGTGHCLYHEAIDLHELGPLEITRASCVEFNEKRQEWEIKLPRDSTVLFSSPSRKRCLDWENGNLSPV